MTTILRLAVLFADVSGSTRLYERLGDRHALSLIEQCVGAMQQVTRRLQGRVVKTIGDEVMAVFDTAAVACRAAMDMQIAVCTLPEAIEHGLTIHCGFHFGEVMIAEQDVFGDTVNVAARLSSLSKAGQIVTSGEVVNLLPDDLRAATRFLDLEPVKGRSAKLEIYEMLWEPDVELTEMAKAPVAQRAQEQIEMVLRYRGRDYRLDENHPAISLGRDARADIVIDDKLASRNHCRVEKLRDKFVFLDFSSNGSFVQVADKEEVLVRRESVVLSDAGTISFGRPLEADRDAAVQFAIVTSN